MLKYAVTFLAPWYLVLLALVPVLWWFSFRRLAVLGPLRRIAALLLRTAVLLLIVAALADVQLVRSSDRLTVVYLLDQSLSIPDQRRREMIGYVNAAIRRHRKHDDRVGVIVFGRDAAIEIPPFDDNVQLSATIESLLDPEYTNLAAAMRLAQAAFPEDAAKRIVIVSDGNQNLGDAVEQAKGLAAAGIGLDAVPVRYQHRAEVAVERLALPNDIRRGEPFDLRAVVTCLADPNDKQGGVVRGRLEFRLLKDDQAILLNQGDEQKVVLTPGKHVFSIRQQIDSPDFYTYEARFIPDRPEDDAMPQNNRATAFTHVRGRGQVLLVENHQGRGQYDLLAQRLRRQDLEVVVRPSNQAFTGLADLQPFDTVVLADAPREDFSDAQIQALVRNTQQMGAGLVMLGGQNSFGAGGWANTELEEAMPVDFQVKNLKVVPRGALVMLMHASEMAEGNYWQKVIAGEAIRSLGPQDLCGVMHWEGKGLWLWQPGLSEVGANRDRMLARVDRMVPGDMPNFEPSMVLAQQAFAGLQNVPVKHMIVISDGDPSPPSGGVIKALMALKVTISTVAIGAHGPAGSQVMTDMAGATGGKSYTVNNPKSLPRIFQREARRIARPLVYEDQAGVHPKIVFPHEMTRGINGPLPPLFGYVLTQKKENALVETSIVAPQTADEQSNTILASWTYGLGKTVAFTSDATARWTAPWTTWENYDKFFSQIVRWSMRPVGDSGKFHVATDVADGRVRVVISALDKNDQFLNFLNISGTVVGPNLQPIPLKIEQTAPGRYQGSFPARDAGSYFLMVSPGLGHGPIRTGVNVPYSDEFRDRATNEALLRQLAAMAPEGGPPGQVLPALEDAASLDALLAVNTFRHDLPKATTSQTAWHYLALWASCLFLADVFVRRVHVSFGWVPALGRRVWNRVLRRQPPPAQVEYIERLRGRKAEIAEQIQQMQAGARFEPSQESLPAPATGEEPLLPPAPPKPAAPSLTSEERPEDDSYTARLLRAKKKVWEERHEKEP